MPNSRKSDFSPRRRARIYDLFHLIVPKVPSDWILLFIRSSAPWMLFRLFRTSAWNCVSSSFRRVIRFAALFLVRTAAAILALKIFLSSAVFIAPYRPAVNEMEFFSVRADWQTTFIDREIYRSVWIIAIFLVLAFFFIHGKLYEFFHAVFFAVEIIIIAAVTCVRDRIFGILTIKTLKSLHKRLKTVHIWRVLIHVKRRNKAIANRALNVMETLIKCTRKAKNMV